MERDWVEINEIHKNLLGPGPIGSPWTEITKMFSVGDVEDGRHRDTPLPAPDTRFKLTPREEQLVMLVGLGRTVKEAAAICGLAPGTVSNHLLDVRDRLKCTHMSGPQTFTALALREGLITVKELISRLTV